MSYTTIALLPHAGDKPPVAVMSGPSPVIRFDGGLTVNLGNHPDPAAYLNRLAAQLIGLAYEYTDAQHAAVAS